MSVLEQQNRLKTVLASLDVMEYLAASDEPVRLTDISRELALPKGQVHRILATLASRNYVQQDPNTRRYFLGLNLWLLGQHISPARPLLQAAQPLLDQMGEELQETTGLSMLSGDRLVYLYAKDGAHPVRAFVPVGGYGPIHATATGKAILAHQSPEFLGRMLNAGLEKFTENTFSEQAALVKEMEETRSRGFSIAVDEWSIGLAGVAAPILDRTGQAFAAIGISFPTSRVTDERIAQMGKIARRVARGIEERLEPDSDGALRG